MNTPGQTKGRYLESPRRRAAEPNRTTGCFRRRGGLLKRQRRPVNSLPRLFLSFSGAPGEGCARRLKKLRRERQNDRGLRVRGLSRGIPLVRRDDVYREPGWRCVSEGLGQEDRSARQG